MADKATAAIRPNNNNTETVEEFISRLSEGLKTPGVHIPVIIEEVADRCIEFLDATDEDGPRRLLDHISSEDEEVWAYKLKDLFLLREELEQEFEMNEGLRDRLDFIDRLGREVAERMHPLATRWPDEVYRPSLDVIYRSALSTTTTPWWCLHVEACGPETPPLTAEERAMMEIRIFGFPNHLLD